MCATLGVVEHDQHGIVGPSRASRQSRATEANFRRRGVSTAIRVVVVHIIVAVRLARCG